MTFWSHNQQNRAAAGQLACRAALPCDPIPAHRAPRWAGARLTSSGFMAAPAAS